MFCFKTEVLPNIVNQNLKVSMKKYFNTKKQEYKIFKYIYNYSSKPQYRKHIKLKNKYIQYKFTGILFISLMKLNGTQSLEKLSLCMHLTSEHVPGK